MLSVVLYGRNDSYGYNLHKRAALSLNCIAQVLDDPDDEILFVDYNTPDDYPTFPEAIQDTLTEEARRRLRILRVRPKLHERFAGKTHLVALEPISRNVAIRRSNPNNRWVLSTNTDLIFIPKAQPSLSKIVGDLPDHYFHIPRFEIPESMWETLDRMKPGETIEQVEEWGRACHLNEIVLSDNQAYKFDGPGDFQLILRNDLFRIDGFHEEMLLGWHVDANIACRMAKLRGDTGDLSAQVSGYHCDHTRQVTPAHRPGRVENDWRRFVTDVSEPGIPQQTKNWGMPDDDIEEVELAAGARYVSGLTEALSASPIRPMVLPVESATFDRIDCDAPHVLPFLVDALASYPRTLTLGWFPARQDLLTLLGVTFEKLGFRSPILVSADVSSAFTLPVNARAATKDEMLSKADLFAFDFGIPPTLLDASAQRTLAQNIQHFVSLLTIEHQRRVDRLPPRRVIMLNVVHSRFERLSNMIGAPIAPIGTRMRQGFVTWNGEADLRAQIDIGPAGMRSQEGITTRVGVSDLLFATSALLPAGTYEFCVELTPRRAQYRPTSMELEVLLKGEHIQRRRRWFFGPYSKLTLRAPFVVPDAPPDINHVPLGVEFRLTTMGAADCRVTAVKATLISANRD